MQMFQVMTKLFQDLEQFLQPILEYLEQSVKRKTGKLNLGLL